MTQVKISVPTFVSEPNCLSVDPVRGQALYEQMSSDVFDDFLSDANFTQDEKALIVHKGERKLFIIHVINEIVDETTLSYKITTAFKVDKELWQLFNERCPELAAI